MCGNSHSTCGRQYNNVLIAATKAQAKDFLRLSQRELSSVLEMLEREYTAIVLDLAGMARAKLLKVVRGMVKQVELQPLPEDWENRVGKTFQFPYLSSNSFLGDIVPPSLHIDGLAFQEIHGVINSRQLSLFNREYSIEIDTLYDRYKGEMIDPWIRKLKEEGEKALLGNIETSFRAAKDLMTPALIEKEDRYKRELDGKESLVGEERVEHLTAVYSNLLAAEGALERLNSRLRFKHHDEAEL
jgi:hypothetical protein